MKTYLINGTIGDFPLVDIDTDSSFCVQEADEIEPGIMFYPGDSIKLKLEQELTQLYDCLIRWCFPNENDYYKEYELLPVFMQDAGYDSAYSIDKACFLDLLNSFKEFPNLYQHLYLTDCQFRISTIKNLLASLDFLFLQFFKNICALEVDTLLDEKKNNTYMLSSIETRSLSSLLESYFTKAYSILDIVTKIAYELDHKPNSYECYKKLKSANILWGDRKSIQIEEGVQTVFARSETIKKIEALRNEVVHNGSWEPNPKVFITFKEEVLVERFMLFPDFEDGHLSTIKSRNHFYGKGTRVNDELPRIHIGFLKELLSTITYFTKKY